MSNATNKNYMLLKAVLTDGHYTSEDFLMVECRTDIPTPTPTPTRFSVPSPTPTPTPTATPSDKIQLITNNDWTYRTNGFLIAKFNPVTNPSSHTFQLSPLTLSAIPQPGSPAPIPLSAAVFIGSERIGNILFIPAYLGKNITLLINANTYHSTINIGQIIF